MTNTDGCIVSDLYKQGKCRTCSIPLFGYKNVRRYLCGDCSKTDSNRGMYARKINDYVTYIPDIDSKRATIILENQIDNLKRDVLYWKEKANANKT